jgi:hypothetical protein
VKCLSRPECPIVPLLCLRPETMVKDDAMPRSAYMRLP